jgi:hypothetical protein
MSYRVAPPLLHVRYSQSPSIIASHKPFHLRLSNASGIPSIRYPEASASGLIAHKKKWALALRYAFPEPNKIIVIQTPSAKGATHTSPGQKPWVTPTPKFEA